MAAATEASGEDAEGEVGASCYDIGDDRRLLLAINKDGFRL